MLRLLLPATQTSSRGWAMLALGCSMALVGSYLALSKPLLSSFPVFVLAWLRFFIGAVAMLRWLVKPQDEPSLTRLTHRRLLVQALFGNFLFSVFMLSGVQLTTAGNAGVVMSTLPATVALLSAWWLRERLSLNAWWAMVLAVSGTGWYAMVTHGVQTSPWLGNALMFGAVCCEATYVVVGKQLTAQLSPRRISALMNLWGLALMTPLALWQWPQTHFGQVPLGHWALLVFYALAASVWSVWLWMYGLRHISAHQAGVFTVLLPVSAALVGVVALGETLGVAQALALALALSGVLLSCYTRKPSTKPD